MNGNFVRRLLPLAAFHFMLFVISLNGRSEPIPLKNSGRPIFQQIIRILFQKKRTCGTGFHPDASTGNRFYKFECDASTAEFFNRISPLQTWWLRRNLDTFSQPQWALMTLTFQK
jgi:hypothetical protein